MLHVDKVFILHYPKLSERKQRMLDAPELQNNVVEWITDFSPDSLDPEAVRYVDLPDAWKSRFIPEWKPSYAKLSLSEISLCAKHQLVYKKIVNERIGVTMILEDDVIFGANFIHLFNMFLSETPQEWDMISFGDGCRFHVPYTTEHMHAYRKLPPLSRASDSYLLKYEAAEKLVNTFNEIFLPSDYQLTFMMNYLDLKCYWWEPTLVTQGTNNGMYKTSIVHCSQM